MELKTSRSVCAMKVTLVQMEFALYAMKASIVLLLEMKLLFVQLEVTAKKDQLNRFRVD